MFSYCKKRECEAQGIFTSVNDSGGGDGVEFYLTREDGTEFGWQAKFFNSGEDAFIFCCFKVGLSIKSA